MQNFQIPFWMRSGQHQIRLHLPLKPICYLMLLNTFIINMKVGYLWYSGMMSVQFMVNYAVYYVLSMEGEVKTFITIKALS